MTIGLGVVLSFPVFLLTRDGGLRQVLSLLVGAAAFAVATISWVALFHRGAFAALGLRSARLASDVGIGALVGLFSYPLITLIMGFLLFSLASLVTGEPVVPPRQEILPPSPDRLEVTIAALSAIVVAPVGEELFFRGFLFGALRRRLSFRSASVVAAVPFAVVHFYLLLMPLLFVFGIVLAWIYERRGSIAAPIAAHTAFNAVGYSLILLL
jgi:hypothetical protein